MGIGGANDLMFHFTTAFVDAIKSSHFIYNSSSNDQDDKKMIVGMEILNQKYGINGLNSAHDVSINKERTISVSLNTNDSIPDMEEKFQDNDEKNVPQHQQHVEPQERKPMAKY